MQTHQLPQHPLDPLTPSELQQVAEIIRSDTTAGKRVLFEQIRLEGPPKAAIHAFRRGDPIDRTAFAVFHDRDTGKVFEALIPFGADAKVSRRQSACTAY